VNNENTVIMADGRELVVDLMSLKQGDDGRLLGREVVRSSDLSLVRDETWLEGVRKGTLPAVEPSLFSMNIVPGDRRDEGMAGYGVELIHNGDRHKRSFSIHSLAPVARRQLARLLERETVDADVQCGYRLNSVPSASASSAIAADEEKDNFIPADKLAKRVTRRTEPIVFESAPLADFLRRSEVMARANGSREEEAEDAPMPVFTTSEAWAQGYELSRRGGECESAAVLTGRLMRDVDSPEIFLVIDACIEAEHAEESEVSVTFTGDTWARVRDVLRQRRKRLGRPHERICGTAHSHPWLPGKNEKGEDSCDTCPKASTCDRTTAVASQADRNFWQTVHGAGQPWSVLLIHGLTATGADDWRLYHLADGSLVPRSIRCLKD
jgi:hypothetical protein